MTKEQDRIELFMRKAGQEIPNVPTIPDFKVRALRATLVGEEWDELCEALGVSTIEGIVNDWEPNGSGDLELIADAIGDLLVVVLGTACACGIKIEPIFKEIMDSNMTKFTDGYKRDDGKWIKGPSYKPAELKPILWDQMHPQ